jgi:hypothetical protein
MARIGHDSELAAIIYQHQARVADAALTNAIDAQAQAERQSDAAQPKSLAPKSRCTAWRCTPAWGIT